MSDLMNNLRLSKYCVPLLIGLLLVGQSARAGSATWNLNPTTGDWNTASNWTPQTVPNGFTDIATFDASNVANISTSDYVFIGSIVFTANASSYNIVAELVMEGAGVINDSGLPQTFVSGAQDIHFSGGSTAGDNVTYYNNGEQPAGYGTIFGGTANAGSASFINQGDSAGLASAYMEFRDHTSAATSTIINQTGDTRGPRVDFNDFSSAASSSIMLEAGSVLSFDNNATAGEATILADGTDIYFMTLSTGDQARIQLSNSSVLDVSGHSATAGVAIGSLSGDSTTTVRLSTQPLTIGGNGVNGIFHGIITEAGSLIKTGNEKLTLTGANTYRGGTTINGGTFIAQARTGSATGTGPVNVSDGTLAGRGTIGGAVTIGTGTGSGAYLAPGVKGPDTLTIANTLTFKSDGVYNCDLSLGQAKGDRVNANGVTIQSGAQFNLLPKGFQQLVIGKVFTVINNTAATAISGTFANLADGSIIPATAGNKLKVSYEGGDGNDLTLTVVP